MFADWTDRSVLVNFQKPATPQGIERNVVITQWDWADPKAYLHDVVSTDRRNPRQCERAGLRSARIERRLRPGAGSGCSHREQALMSETRTRPRRARQCRRLPALGRRGDLDQQEQRPQSDARSQGTSLAHLDGPTAANPQGGLESPIGELFPVANAGRHLAVYDPATKKLTHISTCFGTHHLMFAEDANHTLWTSGGGQVIGWLNTKMFDETQDDGAGWTALIRDANGNGKRDAYVEPDQPLDASKDQRIGARSMPWRRRLTAPSGAHSLAIQGPSSGSRPDRTLRHGTRGDLSTSRRQPECAR